MHGLKHRVTSARQQPAPSPDPLSLAATPTRLRRMLQAGALTQAQYLAAMRGAGHQPDRQQWLAILERTLLQIGTTLTLSGVVFLFAYNWAELHHFAKFGLLFALMFVALGNAHWHGLDTHLGRASLLGAAVTPGVLLAVYGQAYQTGADPYSLFLGWALVIAPWVWISRNTALWVLLLILVNFGWSLFWVEHVNPSLGWQWRAGSGLAPWAGFVAIMDDARLATTVLLLNQIAQFIAISAERRQSNWLAHRWLARTAAGFAVVAISVPCCALLIELRFNEEQMWVLGVYCLAFAGNIWFGQIHDRDLFVMLIWYASLIIVVSFAIIGQLDFDAAGTFLCMGLMVVAMSAGAAKLLRYHDSSWRGVK